MHFLSPYWLYGLLALPLILVVAILLRRSHSNNWEKLVAPRLRKNLVQSAPSTRYWLSLSLFLISLSCVFIALARPYWGESTTLEKVRSRNILLAIDTSKSMLCEDVSTNRLTAAKSIALQMLDQFPNDQIGVMAFAGTTDLIAPLTIDHSAIHEILSQLDAETVSIGGSDLTSAILKGSKILEATKQRSNALIVLSDGEEHDSGIEDAIKEARKTDLQIITIGIGTTAGGTIPDPEAPEGKYRDSNGVTVHTQLYPEGLQQIATETNGAYASIEDRPEAVIAKAIDRMEHFEEDGREQVMPNETYHWFLTPSVAFAILAAFTRAKWRTQSITPLATLLVLSSLSSVETAHAEESWFSKQTNSLFSKPSEKKKAYSALSNKNYDDAAAHFQQAIKYADGDEEAKLSLGLAQALYRQKKWKEASLAYSNALLSSEKSIQQQANYNLGNTLYQSQWSEFEDIGEDNLKDYLTRHLPIPTNNGKKPTESKWGLEDLERFEVNFSSALSKYQNANKLGNASAAAQNIQIVQSHLKTIQELKEALKPEEDKPKEEEPEEEQTEEEKSEEEQSEETQEENDSSADPSQDNTEQNESEDPSEQQGEESNNEQQQESTSQDSEQDQQQQDQQQQDGEPSNDESQQEGEPQDGESENRQPEGEPQNEQQGRDERPARPQDTDEETQQDNDQPNQEQTTNKENKHGRALDQQISEHGYEELEQVQARKLLERHADMQRKPEHYKRTRWQTQNPDIDW